MTEPSDQPDETAPEPEPEEPPDETTNLTVFPDDQPKSGEWVDTDAALSEPTEDEMAEGRRLGEEIDPDDDDDCGVDPEASDG